MARLQLALDMPGLKEALNITEQISQYIDIIEAGTPFIMKYGLEAVRELKRHFPLKEVLCDAKIIDAGAYECEAAFKAGADIVTVLGVSDILTIKECVKVAEENQKHIMVDMICVPDKKARIKQLVETGVDIIAVHTGVDQQTVGRTALDDLKEIKACTKKASVAVAGGINAKTVSIYMKQKPDIVIVGGGILNQNNPVEAAKQIFRFVHNSEVAER